MPIAGKRRRRSGGPPFVQLYRFIKRSQAWHDLSLPARCALIELLDRYTGINNGIIGLGVRELADELKSSHATAGRAMRELDDAGLVRPTEVGVWRGKRATEWRVTFYRCDASGDLPNKSWAPRAQSHRESAKGSPRKRKEVLSLTTKAQNARKPNKRKPAQSHRESTCRI